MSNISYIDSRIKDLGQRIWRMNPETFTKRGITKSDVLEQIGSVRDTIMSLNPSYGYGHTKAYFKGYGKKEAEYIAHAFENAFLGNEVFKKYLPSIYDEMIEYISTLK